MAAFVLRRLHDESHMLVGEARVHQMMNGESFERENDLKPRPIVLT